MARVSGVQYESTARSTNRLFTTEVRRAAGFVRFSAGGDQQRALSEEGVYCGNRPAVSNAHYRGDFSTSDADGHDSWERLGSRLVWFSKGERESTAVIDRRSATRTIGGGSLLR